MNDDDFHNGNRREHLAFLLGEAQQLILSTDADTDEKCKDLIERSVLLMQLLTEGQK